MSHLTELSFILAAGYSCLSASEQRYLAAASNALLPFFLHEHSINNLPFAESYNQQLVVMSHSLSPSFQQSLNARAVNVVCDVIKGRAHNEGLLKLYSGVFAELAPNLGERLFQVSHFVAVCTNRYIGDIRGVGGL